MSGFTFELGNFLKMCCFGNAMIGKPILNEPRKLPNSYVNPDIKIFEPKLSKWYPDYVLVIFTTYIFLHNQTTTCIFFFKNEEKITSV